MSTIPSLGQSLQGEPLFNAGKKKSVEGPGQMGAFHMDTDSYSSEGRQGRKFCGKAHTFQRKVGAGKAGTYIP